MGGKLQRIRHGWLIEDVSFHGFIVSRLFLHYQKESIGVGVISLI
jgi:hypothetical protein